MLTLLDFDEYKIPVPDAWKDRLALNLARTAKKREGSYSPDKGKFGGYTLTIMEAACSVCDSDMLCIVARCLVGSWNESMDFIEKHPKEANTVLRRKP